MKKNEENYLNSLKDVYEKLSDTRVKTEKEILAIRSEVLDMNGELSTS
jgi:hypothetical protein